MKRLAAPKGRITQAIQDAQAMLDQLRAGGMSLAEAAVLIQPGLKAVLANPRATPWRFYCDACHDTGWCNVEPSSEERARVERLYGEADAVRGYVTACEPCRWRQKERAKRREVDDEDVASAGKTAPRRGWSRAGR